MDSLVARPASQNSHAESSHMRTIKEAFRASVDGGLAAGLDVLLRDAREDCEFRPYIASDRVLRGHDEIRAYYAEAIASGTDMKLNPTSFHEHGEDVLVHGSIRVARPTGGFSETQISWIYSFRDGQLAAAGWQPRQAG